MELMMDPVIASDGFSYERTAIQAWLRTKMLCPMSPSTNLPLASPTIYTYRALRCLIDSWLEKNPSWLVEHSDWLTKQVKVIIRTHSGRTENL